MYLKNIFFIADIDFQVYFDGLKPKRVGVGGTLVNVACELAKDKEVKVSLISETGNDYLGGVIIDTLDKSDIDTHSIDRAPDIVTPSTLIFKNGKQNEVNRYSTRSNLPENGLDVVWPTNLNHDAAVVFGGYMAVNPRYQHNLQLLIEHASSRNAKILYFPGFDPSRISSLTVERPKIIEYFEKADIIVTRSRDLKFFFGEDNPTDVYKKHLCFYDSLFINVDENSIEIFGPESKHETIELEKDIEEINAISLALQKVI
ncbi:MAG: hypothetical protein HDS83_03625 [Bacteroidales bacterium]|nr:hypothetical protein [Bacteroidales bacterium]MDE5809024.1 hypothetical protein [Muribaculaceae bacterium]